jgi:hypothetical protein
MGQGQREEATLTSTDAVPTRRMEERLEEIARELMTVSAMLRSAELRSEVCPSDKVERAKLALARDAGSTAGTSGSLRARYPGRIGRVHRNLDPEHFAGRPRGKLLHHPDHGRW